MPQLPAEWKRSRSWTCRVHRDELLMHLDAFYLAATRLRVYVMTVTCSESLFLDRSKNIFRSGLPTGSLTLTYVPMSSWTPQGHREDRWTIRRISRKTYGRQEMSNARNAWHTFWPLIWIFDIQSCWSMLVYYLAYYKLWFIIIIIH